MAEKKKYNSILVSGRKDETLSYSKYIKDEESGESVKESLDKKVNVTDKLETHQIKDGAITNEKMAADSVGNTNLQYGSVSNEKLEDGSITNEKLAENSITKDKLKDNTIGVEKLDPELRQTINAATGLPENLVETIQNVDDTLKDHQSQLDDKQSQIDDKQQQITANDEDISLLQTRSTQMEETIKSIASTGGASQATAVTYNNEKSKLTAVNIQSAVDEVVDKTAIKDEEGTVVETPFRYIQNEEFIFAKVDAEGKLLFGIQWDGTPVFGKTSEVEDRLQTQVTLLAERVATIIGDEDTTNVIDTMNELKKFFAEIENTQTLTSILDNLDNIAKNLDKTIIKDEEGNVQDTPFRVIENEEFIMAVVDSEDKVLFGIYRATGKPYYPQNDMYHISQSEEFLWVILDAVNHPLLGIKQDGTCWAAKAQWLDDIKAIKNALSSIDETLKTFQPKEDGKGLINLDVADSFFYISNDEYIIAVVDAENRILAGIKYDGEPYFPNHEMYSVITNEEWLYAIIDAENKVLGGFRANDGHMIVSGIDISTFIANAIIDIADIKERTAHFSTTENDEYLSVEIDAEGKVIGYTAPDGSHYLYKVKSETIPTEFEHIEDPEGRTEITTDTEYKIMSYRDADGKKYEHDMKVTNFDVSNLNLQGNSVNNIQDALKANGFDVKTPIDWSNEKSINIPIPKCAKVNLITDKMPIRKSGLGNPNDTSDIDCYIEFWDMNGNYFKIPARISAQGQSSLLFIKKNIAIDLFSDEARTKSYKIRFGDWVAQDSFHLKSYYTDFFRGKGPVSYMLYEEMVQTRDIKDDRPYKHLFTDKYKSYDFGVDSIEELDKNFDTGAKCFPQGFPVIVYQKGVFYGIYAWQLKKHRDNMHQDKKTAEHIHLDGSMGADSLFGGVINWNYFEIRNPKNLYMQTKHVINGKETLEYNGDHPQEIMGEDSPFFDSSNKDMKRSAAVKKYIISLSNRIAEIKQAESEGKSTEEIKELIERYFMVSFMIDYILETNITGNGDAYYKNWQWTTYDGIQWVPNPYDHDGCFGAHFRGYCTEAPRKRLIGNDDSIPTGFIFKYYLPELKSRWAELRNLNIFSTSHIVKLLKYWCDRIGYNNFEQEYKKWNESPCNRKSYKNEEYWSSGGELSAWSSSLSYNKGKVIFYLNKAYESLIDNNRGINPVTDNGVNWKDVTYNDEKTYQKGEYSYYGKATFFEFAALKVCKGERPLLGFYNEYPSEFGYFDSLYRVEKWLNENISYLDEVLEYNV